MGSDLFALPEFGDAKRFIFEGESFLFSVTACRSRFSQTLEINLVAFSVSITLASGCSFLNLSNSLDWQFVMSNVFEYFSRLIFPFDFFAVGVLKSIFPAVVCWALIPVTELTEEDESF